MLGPLPVAVGSFCLRSSPHYQNCCFYSLLRSSPLLSPNCHAHHHPVICYSLCESLQIPQFLSPGEWGKVLNLSALCKIRKVAILFFLYQQQLSVFDGWGSREVMWDMWDHWGLQEDWKESCKGFRTAWSERKPEVPNWQLNKPVQIELFPTGENSWLLLSAPYHNPSQNDHLERKKTIAFPVTVTRQQRNIYSFEVIQKQPIWICLMVHCWLETENNLHANPQHPTSFWSPDNEWHQDLFLDWALYFAFRLPSGLLLSYTQKNTDGLQIKQLPNSVAAKW